MAASSGGGPPGGGGGGGGGGGSPGYVESLGRISGPLLAENLRRNEDLSFETDLLYLKVTGTTELPIEIEVGPAPTGFSLTSNSVTLSKSFYSQSLVNSLVGQTAVIDRYPNPPLVYTVVSIATEPLSPTDWRMTVNATFNPAGQVKPVSFYPNAGVIQLVTNDIWDTTGNSIGEKWVAWYKTNLPGNFTTLVQPGWNINVAGTIYVVDYIIEDPVNTNMWRIYVTTSLVAGVGIPIFSAPTYTGVSKFIGVNTDAPNNPLTVLGKTLTTDLVVDTHAETPNFYISTNRIQNLNSISDIYLQPNQSTDPKIVAPRVGTLNLRISNQLIENITNGSDINLNPDGTGTTNVTSSEVYIDGDLHSTGDITWDGDITFGSDSADNVEFSADVNSHIIPNTNKTRDLGSASQRWNHIYTKDLTAENLTYETITINNINLLLTQGNTYYVSVNGNDSYVGNHLHNTYRTINYALSQATAGDTVVIFPGTYEEIFPLTVPAGVTVNGAGIRAVTVKPTIGTNTNSAFLLNGETTVSNLTVKDFYTGYAFSFAPNFTVTSRSPYVQNITVITTGPNAGSGALVDGSLANSASREASMLFHSVTMIVPDAIGIRATNGARVEWLDSFTYFAFQGIHLLQGTAGFANLGTKFGAELRSIGSANVYGTYGAVADGANTLAYLISHNFAYIGTGTDSTNDPSLAIQAFEVVEANSGHIYYESADHKGDVRIGNIFYVNQETGVISFNAQALSFSPDGSISVEGGTSPSYIDRHMVVSGNIKIHDNNIDSLSGPVNFLASSGSTYLNTNVFVTGNTTVSSDINVDGNLYLGNQSTDTITVFSNLTQNLLPDDVGGPFTLGTDTTRWNTLFATLLNVDNVTQLSSNTVSTLTTDTNLVLSAAGTGQVRVTNTDVTIANDLIVGNTLTVNGATSLKNTVIGTTGAVGSAQFSGSNYLSVAGGVGTAMGTGDFTWECWVYPTASSSYQAFIDTRTNPLGGGDTTGFYFGTNYNTITPMYYTNGLQLASSINMTLNAWNHVALTRASGTVTIWVNGSSGGTRTGDTTNLSEQRVFIGSSGLDLYLTGGITNLRIVKGTAVYTIPFATPITALTAIAGTQLLLLEDISANLLKDSSTNNFTVTNNSSVTWSSSSPVISALSPNDLTLVGNLNQTGDTYITGLFANNNIEITGSSYFSVPDIKLQNSEISVTATDSDLTFTGATTGGVVLDQRLKINSSTISNVWSSPTTDTQKSVIFQPNGTGNVTITGTNAVKIPVGNTTTRTVAAGEIRYNDVTNLYEGGAGSGLISFNGLYDSDRNTYITAGATDNTIYFGINNIVKTTLTSTSLNSDIFKAGNVQLTSNTISNTVSGNDLTFSPNGNGNTILNGLPISQNYIVNSLDSSLNLNTTGTGYIKFSGTGGLVVPLGDDSGRRATPELGELRYNTQAAGVLEVFDGTQWMSAVGNNATVSADDVLDILDLWTLILG